MHDPTAVMGRRIGAHLIDLAIGIAVFVAVFSMFSDSVDNSFVDCGVVSEAEGVNICFSTGDTTRYAVDGDAAAVIAITVGAWLVNAVLIQGASGATIGKHLTGLRVVNRDGSPHGIAKALGRWFFFIVDNQPCGVPIVGLVCALASKGHRRVGDMVIGTYVVGKADAGRPVVLDGAGGPGPYGGYGAPPPGSWPQAPGPAGAPGAGWPPAQPGAPAPPPPPPGGGFPPPPTPG